MTCEHAQLVLTGAEWILSLSVNPTRGSIFRFRYIVIKVASVSVKKHGQTFTFYPFRYIQQHTNRLIHTIFHLSVHPPAPHLFTQCMCCTCKVSPRRSLPPLFIYWSCLLTQSQQIWDYTAYWVPVPCIYGSMSDILRRNKTLKQFEILCIINQDIYISPHIKVKYNTDIQPFIS